ncbi:condensation domain-containing protein [Chitinophaga agrisoli]|nr:condensation domain-containing protein [Chitinophaga agrisoli]
MNRKLLFLERFIYGDGTIPKNITFTVKMRGTITWNNLRQALAKVQAKHPVLAAGVVEDGTGVPWFVTPAAVMPVPIRVAERYTDDDWLAVSEEECARPFDMRNGPLMRFVWLRGANISDLMLVCHHCICDGASIVTVMRELLLLLDQPDAEIGSYNSFNSIRDVVPVEVLTNAGVRFRGKLVSLLLRIFLFFAASAKPIKWGRSYFVRWQLSQEETAMLTERCRQEEVTVHAALCVVFLCAFRQVKGHQAGRKVFCPVNLRRYIPAIQPDMLLGFATSTTLTMDANPELPLFEKIRRLNARLTNQLEHMDVYGKLATCEYQHPLANRLERFFSNAKGNHDLTFSNMGRLDIPKYYDLFEVDTVHNPILIFKSANPNGIIASTFNEQLSFSLLSNDAYLPEEEAVAIKDAAMELLFKELMELAAIQAAIQGS